MADPTTARLFARDPNQLTVDIWSDVVCPFCYLGDGLFDEALRAFPHREAVEVRYHSFQLMPDLAADRTFEITQLLVERRGFSPDHIEEMHAQIAAQGAEIGLTYRFDRARPTNTRSAHRLGHFAKQSGRQHEMIRRMFHAYFAEGANIGDYEVLADLAQDIGLDREGARAALDRGDFAQDVEADINLARELGITGVPFFIFNGKYKASGAESVEVFLELLEAAWQQRASAEAARSRADLA